MHTFIVFEYGLGIGRLPRCSAIVEALSRVSRLTPFSGGGLQTSASEAVGEAPPLTDEQDRFGRKRFGRCVMTFAGSRSAGRAKPWNPEDGKQEGRARRAGKLGWQCRVSAAGRRLRSTSLTSGDIDVATVLHSARDV